jgi:peptide/nickel transport system permease protein
VTRRELGLRIAQALLVAFVCVTITFLLVRLIPGNPARTILGVHATPTAVKALSAELHLNQPVWQQYLTYIGDVVRGNLGQSVIVQGQTVASVVANSLPITLYIIIGCVLISVTLAIPLGLLSGLTSRRALSSAGGASASLLLAMPPFLVGLLLITLFAFTINIFPAAGWGSGWPDHLKFIVLPSVALSAYLGPLIFRTVRQAARDVWREEYVEAAIVHGVRGPRLVFRHVLPNVILPVISLVSINIGALITGAVVVEAVFGLPGIGSQLVQAVTNRDYPIIQGIALVTALLVVATNLVADVLTTVADPRTRRVNYGG